MEHLRHKLLDTQEQLNRGYSDALALEEKRLLEGLGNIGKHPSTKIQS